MAPTKTPTAPAKTLKIVSVVLPRHLAHATRCSAAHAGLSLSKYVRRLIETALASVETATINSTDPADITQTDDETIVAAAE